MGAESIAYVAVGSNLGDRHAQLQRAARAIDGLPQTRLLRTSPIYCSTAIGPGKQLDYLNGVFELQTGLEPMALLAGLQDIEAAAGRVRTERWAARTLDLDLLLYDGRDLDEAALTLPHPRLAERNFVVWPLHDLAPGLVLPDGTAIAQLRRVLPGEGLWLEPGRAERNHA